MAFRGSIPGVALSKKSDFAWNVQLLLAREGKSELLRRPGLKLVLRDAQIPTREGVSWLAAAAERSACKCVRFEVHFPRNPR